jgi:hypothetical protein
MVPNELSLKMASSAIIASRAAKVVRKCAITACLCNVDKAAPGKRAVTTTRSTAAVKPQLLAGSIQKIGTSEHV